MKWNNVLLLIFLPISFSYAQIFEKGDSTPVNYKIDIGFGAYYQFSSFGRSSLNAASFPTRLGRRNQDIRVRDSWNLGGDLVTDHPFFHGAYFLKFGGQFNFGEDFKIVGSIIAEQRGFSDGVFSRQTRNFYPYLNATYSKSYGKFSYLLQAGDFWNFKAYEGLTFYNLETQSWIFKLQYDKFYFKHTGIGDLIRGIGLGIDDLYDYSIGLESIALNDKEVLLDVRAGYSNNRGSLNQGFYNFSARVKNVAANAIYAQWSVDRNNNSAFLLGVEIKKELTSKLRFEGLFEMRRYSAGFNQGYVNTVYYRNPTQAATFVNAQNNVFVPLDFFERTFSQWAVFTEYQNQNVTGLMANINADYNLFRRSFIALSLDLNYVLADSENFFYPFYDIAYMVKPSDGLEISLSLTNRVTNLDKNYPTLYLSKKPYFLLRMHKPLQMIRDNSNHSF